MENSNSNTDTPDLTDARNIIRNLDRPTVDVDSIDSAIDSISNIVEISVKRANNKINSIKNTNRHSNRQR